MTIAAFDGGFLAYVGACVNANITLPSTLNTTIDAANEAVIYYGHVITSDGGTHTLDTSGASSLGWRTAAVTFNNAGTTVKVGLATLDAGAGPPARATNSTDVITFSVSKSMTGGGGGVTANAWQSHVPDAGSLSVANGDFIAFAVQATARGGGDSVINVAQAIPNTSNFPGVTQYTGGSYAAGAGAPNAVITFADGAIGWFFGTDVFSAITPRTFNNAGSTDEYGQLFQLPFPVSIYGIYGWAAVTADFSVVLYSDPLGTPDSERTAAIDVNTVSAASGRRFHSLFSSPYNATADQLLVAAYKPGASNISVYYKTLASATHRVVDPWGVNGYGVVRDGTAAFSDANSSLDHYYIGLIIGGFDDGAGSGGGMIRHPGMAGGLNA